MMELNISLEGLLRRELGDPARRGRQPSWRCPFHDDRQPSFTLMPDGRRWKCFGCDRSGDAIDFVRLRHGLSFKEAVAFLDGGVGFFSREVPRLSFPPKQSRQPSPEQTAFRQYGSKVAQDCVDRLHSPAGAKALRWLQLRGLRPETIRTAQIGYNPTDRTLCGIYLRRGITIPWLDNGQVRRIKIRRPAGVPKYIWVKGRGGSGLYLGDTLIAGRPTLLTEGEFDALLGRQELGELVNVATLGSASDSPDDHALEQLLGSPLIYLCYDGDSAGRRGEERWRWVTRRVRTLVLPAGEDLTDLFRREGNLHRWFSEQLRCTGYSTTLHPTVGVNRSPANKIGVGSGTLHLPYTSPGKGHDHAFD